MMIVVCRMCIVEKMNKLVECNVVAFRLVGVCVRTSSLCNVRHEDDKTNSVSQTFDDRQTLLSAAGA